MIPTRQQAEALLAEALLHNPGPWGNHSRTAAHCAEKSQLPVGLTRTRHMYLGFCMILDEDTANDIWVMYRMGTPT